jgi:hypothetical protein
MAMNDLKSKSLGATIDTLADCLFHHTPIPKPQLAAAVTWLTARQGLPGAYAGMFAPTETDYYGIRLFTGEMIRSRAGISHILGEECCRVLALLPSLDQHAKAALQRAVAGLSARLNDSEAEGYPIGTYCCGTCSVAYWRTLANRLLPNSEQRLELGMKELKKHRRSDSQWRRFPFHFTCLALTEIGPEFAKSELHHAAPFWQRNIKRLAASHRQLNQRRSAIGLALLKMCDGGQH